MGFRLSTVVLLGALAACGNLIGTGEDGELPPGRPSDPADARSDSPPPGDDGAVPADARSPDASTCTATGLLRGDTAFGTKTILLGTAKTTIAPSGRIVTIGRVACDGGGLGAHELLPDGAALPSSAPCFGSGDTELVASVWPLPDGYVVATSRSGGTFRARVAHVDPSGKVIDVAEMPPASGYSSTYATFAAVASGKNVWGGYHYSQTGNPDRGFLALMGGPSLAVPADEVPVSAAVFDDQLYVLFVYTPSGGGTNQIVLRRFAVGSALTEDPAFSNGGVSRLDLASAEIAKFDGLQSILVENDAVTVAAPNGSAMSILRFENAKWTARPVTATLRGHLARGCDGSLFLAAAGPSAVQGVAPDGSVTTHPLSNPQQVTSFVSDADGRLYVTQISGGNSTLVRVLP